MARDTIAVTTDWQQIGVGKLVITVLQSSKQALLFNETASDAGAFHRGASQLDTRGACV